MTNSISPLSSTSSSSSGQATGVGSTAALVNENTFLKLLVTQLQHQDPLNPQDGTQFVAQLAQFSGLEQTIQMRQDLDTIKQSLQAKTSQPQAGSASN